MKVPVIAVLAGGTSSEREVSLGSGILSAMALARVWPTEFFVVDRDEVPAGVDARRHVVFSTLHGTFGEDGGMQRLLDAAGIEYAGCGAEASERTMDKTLTKRLVAERGVEAPRGMSFRTEELPVAEKVVGMFGEELIVKPNAEGSSVGLHRVKGALELEEVLKGIQKGEWLVEEFVKGRELTVGVVNGKAMGVVEIRPKSGGLYDYASKYTKGASEYFAPAKLPVEVTASVRKASEIAYEVCGCRDYARVDFILPGDGRARFLEINTLPGMKETSLLPMSARCEGWDFTRLVKELTLPALRRFEERWK